MYFFPLDKRNAVLVWIKDWLEFQLCFPGYICNSYYENISTKDVWLFKYKNHFLESKNFPINITVSYLPTCLWLSGRNWGKWTCTCLCQLMTLNHLWSDVRKKKGFLICQYRCMATIVSKYERPSEILSQNYFT